MCKQSRYGVNSHHVMRDYSSFNFKILASRRYLCYRRDAFDGHRNESSDFGWNPSSLILSLIRISSLCSGLSGDKAWPDLKNLSLSSSSCNRHASRISSDRWDISISLFWIWTCIVHIVMRTTSHGIIHNCILPQYGLHRYESVYYAGLSRYFTNPAHVTF